LSKTRELRDFMFRGLMFESEAVNFQSAGIQVGADDREVDERLMGEALAPFGVTRRNAALEMARLYAVLFCFENEIRDFIRETLLEKEGADWLDKLPPKIKSHAESRRAPAENDTWLEGEKTDLLGFLEFGHLAQVIIHKWECFPVIPSQHWLKQRMDEMEKVRHFIAHNRMLQPSEFSRLYMYVADWNRVIGL
jgi:hypothetical protein